MANVLIEESSLEDIADAIREKNGSSDTYRAADMAGAISNLSSGVSDVQINGTSIVTNNVANIPLASATTAGVLSADDANRQVITGSKLFNQSVVSISNYYAAIASTSSNSASLYFRDVSFDSPVTADSLGARAAYIANYRPNIGSSLSNRLNFYINSPTAAGTGYTNYYDTYNLPDAGIGLTETQHYDIITTKPTYEFTGTWSSSYTSCPCFSAMTVGSQVEIEWKQYGKLVCANFKVMRGVDTSAGSSCYGANIRNDYLPAVTVCSAGYYSSSGVIAKYDTNGTFTCRVVGATLAANNVVQIGMTFMLA